MSDAFFTASEARLTRVPVPLLPQCGACGLLNHCASPKMPVDGCGERGILIIGEHPGREEDLHNRAFAGATGDLVRDALRDCDVDMRRDCWLYNALSCKPSTKTYSPNSVLHCRPNVLRIIRELNPTVIILLGGEAVRSLIGYLWKENTGPVERWVGWKIPSVQLNTWIVPSYQPAVMFHNDDPVLEMDFKSHIRAAVGLAGARLYKTPPDYENAVQAILDVSEAARRLRRYKSGEIAFDYETNMVKPDSERAEIVTCSVCWNGEETIGFPWHGEAVRAVRELLTNPDVAKTGWNAPFEDRWTRAKLGVEVRGWARDGMLNAHLLDPRGGKDKEGKESSGVTGLKFQQFVTLGVPDHSAHIEPFLKSKNKGGNEPNRIREIGLPQLIKYNCLDSLYEWHVTRKQMRRLGME